MKKFIAILAVLALAMSAASAAFAGGPIDWSKYEVLTPEFDVDWSDEDYYFDFSFFEENLSGNDLGATITNWYKNTTDKSGVVTGDSWFFNANSDYLIYFKIDDLLFQNVGPRGDVILYFSGLPLNEDWGYDDEYCYDYDEDLRDGVYGEYRVSMGTIDSEYGDVGEDNMRDFFENGVIFSFADIAAQEDLLGSEGAGWHAGMDDQYPDGNYMITGLRVEVYSQTDWEPYPYQPGVSQAFIYLPIGTTTPVHVMLVRKLPEPEPVEIPEPASYAYGVMGLVSLIGMKKRFGK